MTGLGIYVLAALLSATEYVVGRPAPTRVLVGGPAPAEPDPVRVPERLGRVGVASTALGVVLHATSVVLRGVATERVPWANMYEYLSAVGLAAVGVWLYVLRAHPVRRLAVFVLLPISLLLFVAGNFLYTEVAPVQPSLRSYWIVVHVTAAIMASGVARRAAWLNIAGLVIVFFNLFFVNLVVAGLHSYSGF